MVVLISQLEVAEHDRDLCSSDHSECNNRKKEAKDGVCLVQEDRRQHEVHFEENGSKRNATSNKARNDGVKVPRAGWNLALDVVGAHGHVVLGDLVADEGAEVDERKRHEEPEENEPEQRGYE